MNAAQTAAALRAAVTGAVRMLALEIDAELRRATPVDTGHARRNWIPSVGSPASVEATGEGEHAQGIADVLRYELANGSLWVANVVAYIRRLNYGSSQQAPSGFVEAAIATALAKCESKLAGKIDISNIRTAFARQTGGGNE